MPEVLMRVDSSCHRESPALVVFWATDLPGFILDRCENLQDLFGKCFVIRRAQPLDISAHIVGIGCANQRRVNIGILQRKLYGQLRNINALYFAKSGGFRACILNFLFG